MRYSLDAGHLYSLFLLFCSLFPVPCSLFPKIPNLCTSQVVELL
ncbi:hypothetical protein [Moorena sp. SIO4G3]|nr:hypothetical protein [Moorena sp. SIO4G3]